MLYNFKKMVTRHPHNPILKANPNLPWQSIKVYNPAVYFDGSNYHMLFRGVGNEWISRIGYAKSTDGVKFEPLPDPVLSPSFSWESAGCEDPRIVFIDNQFWVTYTAFDGKTARAAITSSPDLIHYGERKILFPGWDQSARQGFPLDWSKGGAILPQKINNRYYMLFGDSRIWIAASDDLINWTPVIQPLFSARPDDFDAVYVETGPPPVLTDRGWLVIYHGVDRLDSKMTYRIGAALLDKDNPAQVIWRCNEPIIEPEENYEKIGFIDVIEGGFDTLKRLVFEDLHKLSTEEKLPKAIFCCGALLEDNQKQLRIYYGGSDTVICTATIDLEDLFRT